MKSNPVTTMPLEGLKINLFVRKALNQDHVMYLAQLIESGVTMRDRIKVAKMGDEMWLVDGRHRAEAYDLNGIKEVEVEVVQLSDEAELIAEAYRSNVGGSLPPTTQDTEQTVALLLEHGETKKRIGELLGLPTGLARRYVNGVQSKLTRAKLLQAAEAVTEGGLTVVKSAEHYGVDVEKLKEILTSTRRKEKQGVAEAQRTITQLYRSVSAKNGRTLKHLLEKYEDGDVNKKQVREIFAHLEQVQKRSARALADWKKRFEALSKSV